MDMFSGINFSAVFIVYLILANIGTFVMFGVDKKNKKSKSRKNKKKRINEDLMLLLCFPLSCVGGLLGMLIFHNKTTKKKFRIGLPLLVVTEGLLYSLLVWTGAIVW